MATIRHLNDAPISEAVIDFRVKLPKSSHVDQFASLKTTLCAQYPIQKDLHHGEFMIGIQDGQPIANIISKESQLFGYRLETNDNKSVVQFRSDGFTYSRLKPYTDWNSVFGEARKLWKEYVVKVSPEEVIRIAVRYINQIPLKSTRTELSYPLEAPPSLPETLTYEVNGFLSKVTIRDPQLSIQAHITQSLNTNIKPGDSAIILLDINVFKVASYSCDEAKMWEAFAELHAMKNHIFFNMITEETARRFE